MEPQVQVGADRLESRLEFETFIADTSAALLAAPPEALEAAAARALERVRGFFEADLCAFLQVADGGQRVNVRLASYAAGLQEVSPDLNLTTLFPWSWHRLLVERAPVRVSSRSELPPEAAVELPMWEQMGTRSVLSLPIEAEGEVRHVILLHTVFQEREWPDPFVDRLRVLGGMLAAALDRATSFTALREAEARVSVAADSAGAGLWVFDPATRTFWVTDRARAIFGYRPDEVITFERFRASVHPEDRAAVRTALDGDAEIQVEYRILLPDGGSRWISSSGRPHRAADGRLERITGASIDVSARKAAEEALRRTDARLGSAAELAGLAFYEVDFERRVAYVDERFRAICGVPEEATQGLGPVEFWIAHLHPDDRPRVLEQRARFHDGRSEQASLEYRYVHPRRGERWLHHLAKAVRRGASGHVAVTYGVLRDITDRKQADEERADLSRRLLRAHEDERAMLARELHDDVTQRLAVLAIEVGRAELTAADAGHAASMRTVREGLSRLAEDVHALAYHLHPSVLEELGLVEALRTSCERFAGTGAVALTVEFDPVPATLPREVALCLFRVAQEALSNVARHSGARAARLVLRHVEDGLLLSVRDDGSGFDPSARPRRSLGLASMRERVALLNGTFEIESAAGEGTQLLAFVPVEAAPP